MHLSVLESWTLTFEHNKIYLNFRESLKGHYSIMHHIFLTYAQFMDIVSSNLYWSADIYIQLVEMGHHVEGEGMLTKCLKCECKIYRSYLCLDSLSQN